MSLWKEVDIWVEDELRMVRDMFWLSLGRFKIPLSTSENSWGIYTLCQLSSRMAW